MKMREISDQQLRNNIEYHEDYSTLQSYAPIGCRACPQVVSFAEKLALNVLRNASQYNFRRTRVKSVDEMKRGQLMLEAAELMSRRFELCPGPSIVDPNNVDESLKLPVSGLFSETHHIPNIAEECGLPHTEQQ